MEEYCIGVDIGGTEVKCGLFTLDGTLLTRWEIPTDLRDSGSHIISDTAASVKERITSFRLTESDIKGVGIGVPGPVVGKDLVEVAVNLGWKEYRAAREMEQLTGFWTSVANDANLAALGEMWKGSAAGCMNAAMITIGTGVGCGVVVDGKMAEGFHGCTGEIGHIRILAPEDIVGVCGCGRTGCLEQAASGNGIVKLVKREVIDRKRESSLSGLDDFSSREIFDAAKAGDKVAAECCEKMMGYLARACSVLACVLDPEVIIIGGGVSGAGEYLIDGIRERFEDMAFPPLKKTPVRIAALGNKAGIYGAAKMVHDM